MLRATIASAARTSVIRTSSIARPMGMSKRFYSADVEDESYDALTERYVRFFDGVEDLFELQRGLNNAFAYDLVPPVSVVESALKASRRVNDYATAVRVFEGLKEKVENETQYEQYLQELAPLKNELGVLTKEELGF
ncbi:cytochrome c oxidase subunit VA-domain-containing protein [Halteromyces radiatus]|uniref:cytochrome c oxidase subunit VA-domain-containing protein n=1 Tax=Halteromyces radiatus TaxID=101107 RepID=UPI00221ED58F|nr:cytochrome c oxidase subunit VA-domain-containing protein [Halteromyces radiatus]KAI8092954.1 cytochrome c oxidase subunit VA-domain-containing protein [Halteromyces radiatus]